MTIILERPASSSTEGDDIVKQPICPDYIELLDEYPVGKKLVYMVGDKVGKHFSPSRGVGIDEDKGVGYVVSVRDQCISSRYHYRVLQLIHIDVMEYRLDCVVQFLCRSCTFVKTKQVSNR